MECQLDKSRQSAVYCTPERCENCLLCKLARQGKRGPVTENNKAETERIKQWLQPELAW